VGKKLKNTKETKMKCQVCGSNMKAVTTDLPFKANNSTIVIMKALPVYKCENCSEFLLEDNVMVTVENIIGNVDASSELEVIKYAAAA
jgi:YgiT-type zinc finger domain-containing protein